MIPEQLWLPQARRLAIGNKVRVRHLHEHRENMIIANAPDRWWCYCQRCKDGGVVLKDHVLLQGVGPVDTRLDAPDDVRPVAHSDFEIPIARFLAGKGMAYPYFDVPLYYSESRKRLVITQASYNGRAAMHGRDLTGRSPMKWLNYSGAPVAGATPPGLDVIVVEDLFSKFKVQYAMKHAPNFRVLCSLGTGISAPVVTALCKARSLYWFYDGDDAGDSGYNHGLLRLRPFVQKQYRPRPPDGKDPKDLTCQEIRDAIAKATVQTV